MYHFDVSGWSVSSEFYRGKLVWVLIKLLISNKNNIITWSRKMSLYISPISYPNSLFLYVFILSIWKGICLNNDNIMCLKMIYGLFECPFVFFQYISMWKWLCLYHMCLSMIKWPSFASLRGNVVLEQKHNVLNKLAVMWFIMHSCIFFLSVFERFEVNMSTPLYIFDTEWGVSGLIIAQWV